MTNYSTNRWRYCWFLGGTDHRNLGDHLICASMKAFIADIDPSIRIREIPLSQYFEKKPYLMKAISEDDVLLFGGGGFLGNLWPNGDVLRRDAFRTWPDNRKIVFPQCSWFSEDEEGQAVLQESEKLYKGDHVLLALRDKASYDFAQKHFNCRLFLLPDIALYSIFDSDMKKKMDGSARDGARLMLRGDKESGLSEEERKKASEYLSSRFEKLVDHDNMSDAPCDESNRMEVLQEALEAIASSKVVLTDRLHGMIFCAITGTPCIVLNLNKGYHKIGAAFDWVRDLPYIRMTESLDEALEILTHLELSKTYEYPVSEKRKEFREFMTAAKAELEQEASSPTIMPAPPVLVSVIIPVYNEEVYLEECLNSVVSQTLQEIEIICVNDGSTDRSPQILEAYKARDPRITCLNRENGGLSRARNAGIEQAKGKYILFLDSDDMLRSDALEKLVQRAEDLQLDMLLYNLSPFCEEPTLEKAKEHYAEFYHRNAQYDQVYAGLEMQELLIKNHDYQPAACGYLIRSNLVKEESLRFVPGILHEDNAFTFQALTKASRVSLLPEELYQRRLHAGSITQVKESIRNSYGYLASMTEMIRTVISDQGLDQMTEAQMTIIGRVGKNAADIWNRLPVDEQLKWKNLPGEKKDALLVCLLEQRIVDTLEQKLQSTYEEKSAINAKLQQTYGEKSELNEKLQKTYKEKAERGIQIKELEKQVRELTKEKQKLETELNKTGKGGLYKLMKQFRNGV